MILDSPIISGSSTVTGDLTVLGTLIANVSGSSISASYATNAELLDGLDSTSFTTTSSFNTVSGSFSTRVTNLESFSSSLDATFATDAQLTAVSQSFSSSLSTVSESLSSRVANNEATGSSLTTASSSFSTRVTNTEATASSLVTASGSFSTRTTNLETASGSFSTRVTNTEATASSLTTASSSFSTRVTNNESNISSLQTASGSFSTRTTNLETASGSFSTRTTNLETASGSFSTRVTNAESSITSLNSKTGSYATTGSNRFIGNQTITGSLFVTENLTVLGSSSISYVSQSTLNIGTNLITVNAQNPSIRFGGLAVIDSGSSPQVSGSWLFDSVQDRWIMIHQQTSGGTLTSSIAIMGPETYNDLGNETTITLNRLVKGSSGASGEHISNSNISDTGTVVSINSNTQITGSLVTNSTASFAGNVGIGTTTPVTKLDIIGNQRLFPSSGDVNLSLRGYAAQYINFTEAGVADRGVIGFAVSSGDLVYRSGGYDMSTGTERIRITSAGNVGIGTTSPYQNLQVYQTGTAGNNYVEGTVQVGGTSSTLGAALSYAAQNSGYVNLVNLNTSGGANARISLGFGAISSGLPASTVMTLNQSGNVGIGTTSPGITLDVKFDSSSTDITGSGASSLRLLNTQASNTNNFHTGIWFRLDNGINNKNGYIKLVNDATNAVGDFAFILTQSGTESERVRIKGNGNVGIGTSSPGARLQIQVDSDFTGGVNYTTPHLFVRSGASAASGNVTRLALGIFDGSQVYFDAICTSTGGGAADLAIATRNVGAPTEKMRITAAGNVGIGTTSPSAKLTIDDASTITNTQIDLIGNSSTPKGHIGQFAHALYLASNYYYNGSQNNDNSGFGQAAIVIAASTTNTSTISFALSDAGATSPSNKVLINSAGNVGIGTTSPYARLSVVQDITTTAEFGSFGQFTVQGSTNVNKLLSFGFNTATDVGFIQAMVNGTSYNNLLLNARGGNVGIGITAPTSRLHVTGSTDAVRFEGSGSNIFAVDGTSGRLFSVDDDLTNSLFSVNTIAGLPVIEAFADNTVRLGKYSAASGSAMTITGSNYVYINTPVNPVTDNAVPQLGILAGSGTDAMNIKHIQNGNNTLNIWQTGTTSHNAIAFYKGDTQTNRGLITVTTSGTTYNSVSDYRLKENITPLENGLDRVLQLKPSKFNWIETGDESEGFIAHEIQEIFPDAVTGEKDAVYSSAGNIKPQSVDYGRITPLLVKAIQELTARVKELENK